MKTESVQRTIRKLVSNLTSEIFIRLEGPQLEFNTTLQSRLEVVLKTIEKHFKDSEHLNAAKAVHWTIAVHQLNLTNTHLTETWECA
jgi:capsule polysaccharide export protein KpsC/LpsZ